MQNRADVPLHAEGSHLRACLSHGGVFEQLESFVVASCNISDHHVGNHSSIYHLTSRGIIWNSSLYEQYSGGC